MDGIIDGFKKLKKENYFYCFGLVIFLFMTTLGLWLTVKIISPLHFLTSDSIITVELIILVDINGYLDKKKFLLIKNPLFYIFSIITIFACLVYNEIVIINIFNLNYNTREEIVKRESKEVRNILYELSRNSINSEDASISKSFWKKYNLIKSKNLCYK